MTDAYLAHHGILGQKWGVRRFQNKDGSLTDAGKQRAIERPSTWKGPNTARYNRANRRADKGLMRRAKGETITDNYTKAYLGTVAIGVAALAARGYMRQNGIRTITMRYGNKKLGSINDASIVAGATIASAMIYGRAYMKNRQIRTSYQRDHYGKNSRWAG